VLLGVWLGTLQFMLDQGKNADWFNSRMIASLAALTAAAFAAWLIWGCTDPHPAVDMAFDHLAQTGPNHTQSVTVLTRPMASQRYHLTSLDIFWISGWLSLPMVPFVWMIKRPQSHSAVPICY